MTRLLAKHLPKHIPGKPTILVENMEGASSIIASNHLYNIVKPDGLTIGTFNRALPFRTGHQAGRGEVRHNEVCLDRLLGG